MVRRVSDAADRTEQGAKVASAQGGGNPVAQGRQGTPCSAVRFQFLANSASQLSTFWATNLVKLTNCTAECINIAASVIACISASRVEHCIDLEECMHANTTANTYAFWLPRTRPRTAHHHRPPRHHNNCRNRRVRACEQPGVQGLLPHNMARPARDPERPIFHVAPLHGGWMNDPNGPIMYRGRYHLFYQHLVDQCEWGFGLVWGHAVSSDLVTWEHLPPALVPTPASSDADGCFSGCAVLDECGRPIIMYTGVRLRSNPDTGPLPPKEHDLNQPFIETQCIATPVDDKDELLVAWHREEQPFLELPPALPELAGWRDPFIFEIGGNGKEWGMLMGSGFKDRGGATLVYRSHDLRSGWREVGMLCEAESLDTGKMWECPILVQLPRVAEGRSSLKYRGLHKWSSTDSFNFTKQLSISAGAEGGEMLPTSDMLLANPKSMLSFDEGDADASPYTHFFCVSPDAPVNPSLYWIGSYNPETVRFDLDNAKGPFKLDLGDVLYAPNMMTDDRGRHLLWGWLQERRRVGSYDYSGCLSLPRVLCIRGDTLVQEPAPEVVALRQGESWHGSDFVIFSEEGVPLQVVGGQALEIEVTLSRYEATAAGVHFKSWRADSEDAIIVVDWQRQELQAIFTDGADVDMVTMHELAPELQGLRSVGGPLEMRPSEPITLRVFVDHSCVEVYASTGQVLTTRVYRGEAPPKAGAGIELVAYGGAARVESVTVWEMGSIWKPEAVVLPPPSLAKSLTRTMSALGLAGMAEGQPVHPILDNISLSSLSDAGSEADSSDSAGVSIPLQFEIDTAA